MRLIFFYVSGDDLIINFPLWTSSTWEIIRL